MFPNSTEVGKYFHEMFKFRWDEYSRSSSLLVVNPTKRRKKFADEEGLIYKPLNFEIFGNVSAFGIFEISRLAVFEKFLRRTSYLHLQLQALTDSSSDASAPPEVDIMQGRLHQPEISDVSEVVKIGVRGVFELISGSKTEYPDLCVKAVNSLLTLLEGLQLESLSNEPSDIINDIFDVLLNVVHDCLNENSADHGGSFENLVEISSAALLSFAVIRGDTGKMLRAICTILTSKHSISHNMILPNAVIELQKSVQSIIIGKLKHPTWFSHGVLRSSSISAFRLLLASDDAVKLPLEIKNMACDGCFLYVYTTFGLYKIGTGYNGTIPRNVYAYNPAFFGQENGWIGYTKKTLYFILIKSKNNHEFYAVNTTTLELEKMLRVDANISNLSPGLLFVNDDYLCLLSSSKEDSLTVRYLEVNDGRVIPSPDDLHLKLSEKYFKLFGSACEEEESKLSSSSVGVHEELVAFASGKEFSLLQTADGKVLYNCKLGNQNLRIPGVKSSQCWVELMCPKMSIVKQCVIGNEGSIGLLVYNDGSVYFIGFARRGEDGENGVVRRQCCQIKPRKMTRMEGKNVTYAACNYGSTALVTDKGELYMYGKDAVYCEAGTGLVSDLKNVRVRQVALGKVHVIVLTDKGHVYTFGYNGRGQCGRYFSNDEPGRYEGPVDVSAEEEETSGSSDDTYSDVICPKGTHVFKQDKCVICPICHQCTGYGASCLASNEEDREPGEECGCGDGDAGCAKCCICKICAFEEDPEQELDDDNDLDDLIKINLFGAVYERNERKARAECFQRDNPIMMNSKENVARKEVISNANNPSSDSMNMMYLSPARVYFRSSSPVVQIGAGLYHSVVLLENGEVYTFGSNALGQLGVSDVNHVGPVRANLPSCIVQISAGSNHTVALTSSGEVYTFGSNSKNQLGESRVPSSASVEGASWNNVPQLIPSIGAEYQEKAIAVWATGDLTYLRVKKTLVNSATLQVSTFVADKNNILLLPVRSSQGQNKSFECIVIEKISGNFKSFHSDDQVDFINCSVCFDPLYNVLWSISYTDEENTDQGLMVNCYNVMASDIKEDFCSPNILDCELALPVVSVHSLPCYQIAIHVLACLDMLAQARSTKDALKSLYTEQKRVINTRTLRKEDFNPVNRFQALGNSWTYNTHNAVEAIRFSCDTDVLLGGIGLYGGRGNYHAKIKLFDIGYESSTEAKDDQLLVNTEEIVYECSLKQIYSFMFEEPILLQANRWYIIWAQIKGSPSDCGNSGQSYVITDDEVIFHFKASLLSNNGTNVACGQIPQLLYRILQPEFIIVTNYENPLLATVHILSKKFSHTVSEDGFRSLIDLLSWCWEAFKTKYRGISNMRYSPSLLESVRQFDRLVYINQACQHLIRAFIFETYPDDARIREKKSPVNYIMAELMGDVRELLQRILSDPFLFENFIPKRNHDGSNNIFYKLVKHIVKECSDTFISCFYVFYPTPMLKWIYLSYLLNHKPEHEFKNDFLITATLSALYASNIHLKTVFPVLLGGFDPNLLFQQNKKSNAAVPSFHKFFPVLSETMMNRTEGEISVGICSWLFVVEKILDMASQPVKDALRKVQDEHDTLMAYNSCHILSKLVAELSAEAMGINDEVQRRKEQMLQTTPVRFRRINVNKSWNTGNGSPDAISFTVNKPGVVIIGVCVFGGTGNYDYEVELLDEGCNESKNNIDQNPGNSHTHWKCIAMCRGSFGSSDYNGKDMVELNFEYPASIQENTKYVIKLRLRGNRTNNGELGQAVVTGPDDTTFTFLSTDLSFNGTSVSRGQIPYIVYYRYPQRSTQELKQKISIENQAREAIMAIAKRIFAELTFILCEASEFLEHQDAIDILIETPFVKILIPLLVTHLSPLVALNAKNACEVLKLIEGLLPMVCAINKKIIISTRESSQLVDCAAALQNTSTMCTTSPHYSVVESEHPYKRATVSKYIVKFPESVLWMSLEFDPRCGTTQEEDVLKIYVPDFSKQHNSKSRKLYRPLPRMYGNNRHSWPGTAIILPGNEVVFSLESASKYSSHDRGTSFGFKCLVIGFEMVNIDGIPRLELELTTLACRCASYLIKKKCVSGLTEEDFSIDNINMELAEVEYRTHSTILNRGLDLCREETLERDLRTVKTSCDTKDQNILDPVGTTFLSGGSNERTFLTDFVNYKLDSSGGRLARWLQPDSFVDPDKCEVIIPRAKIKCGWSTSLAIVTRDQHGDIVEVPDLKVTVICVPLSRERIFKESETKNEDGFDKKLDFSVPYKAVTTSHVRYNAITFMKEYSGFSFEELRYMTPTITLEEERLSVVANHNGIYTANWTPKEVGLYSVSVVIDGYAMKEMNAKIEVKMPPFGIAPPVYNKSSCASYLEKKLKFERKYSAGLRIRTQPSLQAEQIGIILQDGVVTYIDEIENEDGIWVKLTHECVAQNCKQLFPEAWCLKYNKHYECELLTSFSNQTTDNHLGKVIIDNDTKVYQVVKCGVSGHNVRAYPSLKAPTVGMIFAEQRVTSDEQIYNKEGMWIKLDRESLKNFDLTQFDSVWSLAVDKSQIVYLRNDSTINKDLFLKALKWDEFSYKKTRSESICSSSSSDDSDDDHNHNYFVGTKRKKIVLQSSKDDGHYSKVQRSSRSSKTTPTRKISNDNDVSIDNEKYINQINQRNLVNFNIPPTPKKQKKVITETEKMYQTAGGINVPDVNDSLSNSCSGSINSSDSSQFDNFIDVLEKANDQMTVVVSSISDRSSALSSGYQASIETSSDSLLIFKSDTYAPSEETQPTLTQTGTQTSPKFFPKIASAKRKSPDSSSSISVSNVNEKKNYPQKSSSNASKYFEDSIFRRETVGPTLSGKLSEQCKVAMYSDSKLSFYENEIENSPYVQSKHNRNDLQFLSVSEDVMSNSYSSEDDKTSLEPSSAAIKVSKFSYQERNGIVYQNMDDTTLGKSESQKSEIQYKMGVSPSVAESVRAVFAAFLWHEGVVHDAMTCASLLKFYPEFRMGGSRVIKRTPSGRTRDASQRYSVEVGLTGNSHHIIKPSTLKSLPSNPSGESRLAEGIGDMHMSKEPPLTLEYLSILWSEISNTCFQLFSKSTTYSTSAYMMKNDKEVRNSENIVSETESNGKYVTKWSADFCKKVCVSEEVVCDLCNEKFTFPITYHMKNVHKGCGKMGVTKGYTVNGKYSLKLKGNCGEGGKKSSPWYILCDACREQYLQVKRLKPNACSANSPTIPENISISTGIHLIMKENALFALDLSGNCNKLTPIVSTFPHLKTFGCLASFGIDSDVVPSDTSFSLDTGGRMRSKDEMESENEEAPNVMNNFQRSVFMIGRTWKSSEDNFSSSPGPSKRHSALCELENFNMTAANHTSTKLETILKDIRSSTYNGKIDRPIMAFLSKYHNLPSLKSAMKLIIKKAIYKNYSLRAFDWLLRTVTTPVALHDIMWWFVSSFSIPLQTEENYYDTDGEWNDEFDLTRICEHPLVDMALAGEARQHIPSSFHTLLQSIADLMVIFPVGSPLQQMAIKCWGFQFTHSDYNFLHRSKLFVNISKILSRSESEEEQDCSNTSLYESHPSTVSQSGHYVEVLREVTSCMSITVSSQSQLIQNLTDNSTETYWESGEEDRRKMKTITISSPQDVNPHVIYIHVDNTRDANHKVSSIMILTGSYVDSPRKLRSINLDADYCGWVTTFLPESDQRMIRIDCKGDSMLRIRQIKVTGELKGESPRILQMPNSFVLQQRQCESETLKVFRLIIFQVFGELIENFPADTERNAADQHGSSDLKEHMVGILFSRRRLNNLQKQVCTHIVQTIKRETCVLKEEWEKHTNYLFSCVDHLVYEINDSYCFEMLCMVSALSGSDVGRSYLAQQFDLISDLLILLHVGTTRLQRQVVLLLKRVLPEVSPEMLAEITGVESLPLIDFRMLASKMNETFDTNRCGILDIFLSVIAKILCVQVKTKNGSGSKETKTVVMSDLIDSRNVGARKWYLKGNMSRELAIEVDSLLKEMSEGKISDSWRLITKAAVAENILNLANLSKLTKDHNECLRFATFWNGLASLSVVDSEHVEKLSSANWKNENDESASPRPLCSNHDDGKTLGVMQCSICGLLCLECDRFFHLNRKTKDHERRVCKEEEEAIKVDVHEGCGRVKLFWMLALVDSNTFKGVVEFRENSRLGDVPSHDGVNSEICRFCSRPCEKDCVCHDDECQIHASIACSKVHRCGHICGGIKDEEKCLPCLFGCSADGATLKQDADDMCMICFTEALSAAPSIQLQCGHVFHYNCCKNVLLKRWAGPRITFNFQQCPICKRSMQHNSLKDFLSPIWDLMKEVRKKALMRLEYEGCPSNYEDRATYAMEKYAYYVCFKCKKAYYGGEARCEAEVDHSEYNPEELICGGCSDISGARVCPKHGTDFLEYKCRYCCSVAVYFCFGTTHFCNACHEDFQNVISMLPSELPSCPAGPKGTALNVEDCPLHIKHPPTGEEFALGCGVCRTGRNF